IGQSFFGHWNDPHATVYVVIAAESCSAAAEPGSETVIGQHGPAIICAHAPVTGAHASDASTSASTFLRSSAQLGGGGPESGAGGGIDESRTPIIASTMPASRGGGGAVGLLGSRTLASESSGIP